MIMPLQLVGKMSVDEWHPLMASSMIYEKRVRRSLWPMTALITTIPLLVLALVFAVAVLLDTPIIALLYFVLVLPITILGNRLYNPSLMKGRLRADSEAAQLVGRDRLVAVLRKLDGMGLQDIDTMKTGRRIRGVVGFPNIAQRIENLQGYPI